MEVIRFTRLAATGIQKYASELFPLLRDATDSTIETLYLYTQLLYHILRPIFYLILTIQASLHPHLRPLLKNAISGFLSQSPRDILLETIAVIVVVFLGWLEWKRGYARRLRRWVSAKSKVAGLLFPHLVYWAVVGTGWWFWPRGVGGLANIFGVGSIAVVWPTVRTVWLVYAVEVALEEDTSVMSRVDEDDDIPGRSQNRSGDDVGKLSVMVKEMLKYWVVFGVAWGIRSICHYWAPVSTSSLLSTVDAFLFYWFLWLRFPMTNGTRVIYEGVLSGMSRSYLKEQRRRTKTERLNVVMRLFVACNVLSEKSARIAEDTIAESGLILLGVVFFITPRFATFVGTVLVGCFFPSYLSASALVYEAPYSQNNWISYWAIYGVFDTLYSALSDVFGWVPLWYHAKLAIILWLQLPYYRGAAIMLERGVQAAAAAASDLSHKKITPRKRKRE